MHHTRSISECSKDPQFRDQEGAADQSKKAAAHGKDLTSARLGGGDSDLHREDRSLIKLYRATKELVDRVATLVDQATEAKIANTAFLSLKPLARSYVDTSAQFISAYERSHKNVLALTATENREELNNLAKLLLAKEEFLAVDKEELSTLAKQAALKVVELASPRQFAQDVAKALDGAELSVALREEIERSGDEFGEREQYIRRLLRKLTPQGEVEGALARDVSRAVEDLLFTANREVLIVDDKLTRAEDKAIDFLERELMELFDELKAGGMVGIGEPVDTDRLENLPSPKAIDQALIFDRLMAARSADWVTLIFKDGGSFSGAIVFNEFRRTGTLINPDDEISIQFHSSDLCDVKI